MFVDLFPGVSIDQARLVPWSSLQVLLLKCCKEITRDEAIKLWAEKWKAGWQVFSPKWTPPPLPWT
ncbi:MAG: DUF1651 domain-containing protein [Cyanobium sp.]